MLCLIILHILILIIINCDSKMSNIDDNEDDLGLCDDDSSDEDDDQIIELITNSREIVKRMIECNSGEEAKKSRER